MQTESRALRQILRHPGRFLLQVVRGFHANQGMLLSGAVAYYTLLSIVPLFILVLLALSHVVEEAALLATLARYLEWVVPGETEAVVAQVATFLNHRDVLGWVVVGVLLFFSSMAFTMLENAMSVIFFHRVAIRRRHFLVSAVIPYVYILCLGIGFLLVTLIAGALLAVEQIRFELFGENWSLDAVSGLLLYLIGLLGQILMLTSIYMVMPVGNLSLGKALIGGIVAGLLWEIVRHVLVWYFSTLSFVNVVYGSLATVIVALLSLEVAGMILLLGAQVIAEYERLAQTGESTVEPERMRTES